MTTHAETKGEEHGEILAMLGNPEITDYGMKILGFAIIHRLHERECLKELAEVSSRAVSSLYGRIVWDELHKDRLSRSAAIMEGEKE